MRGSKRFNPSELIGPIVIVILAGAVIATFITAILLYIDSGTTEITVEQTVAGQSPPATGPAATSVEIKMISPLKFDINQIAIAADEDVEITAANTDGSIPHNFSIYRTQSDYQSGGVETVLFTTPVCSECTEAVIVNLPASEYFFQCDVHPDAMVGTLIAR